MRTELERMRSALPAEADALVDALRTRRLTVLTGAPGAGKTRLLRDGVLPRLRRRSDDGAAAGLSPGAPAATGRRRGSMRPRELVVWCDRWDGSPVERVHAGLDAAIDAPPPDAGLPRPPLALRAKALSAEHGARLFFLFDHGDRIASAPFAGTDRVAEYDALVNALCSVSPSVHVLLTARDGALPPSVQARLGTPDTRTWRLPDPVDAAPPPPGALGPERPMGRDDVYAAIAARLGAAEEPPGSPAEARREPFLAPPSAERGAADAPRALPAFAPGSFATASVRRDREARRVRVTVLAVVGLALAVGLGVVLWHGRADSGAWPGPSERRLAAATARARGPAGKDFDAAIASVPPEAASAPVVPPAATPVVPPAMDADAASGPQPAASVAPPVRTAVREPSAETTLADDLWREMSRHGVARLAAGADDDPVEALATGRRLAVVPYDALRSLAGGRGALQAARIVAPLFTEEMHVIVRTESPVAFIHQIAGRQIDVGPPGSARRLTAVAFLGRLFARPPGPGETRGADLDTALADLLGGRVDAIVLPEPQPSPWLSTLPAAQQARLRLVGAAPGDPSTRRALRSYLPATLSVPAAIGGPAVETFAVMTFLVANPATPVGRDDTATVTAKALCRSLPELRRDGHPKWREVDPTLQLPVPLPYDPEAVAVLRACDAGSNATVRRPSAPATGLRNDNPHQGERE